MDGDQPTPLKILIAEDARLVRRLIVELVNESPHDVEVTQASDGTEACRHLLSGEFDIAFLNVTMPGIDGIAALELAHRKDLQTFVIIIASDIADEHLQKAREFRAYEFLKKPFSAERVVTLLDSCARIQAQHRILVVDDSATVRRIVRKILQKSFFHAEIEEAGDGQSTVDICLERPFDVVFLDVTMPGMSGVETLRHLRKAGNATKVILMTASEDFQLSRDDRALEVETLLHKPFSPEDVDRVLHNSFGIAQPALTAAL